MFNNFPMMTSIFLSYVSPKGNVGKILRDSTGEMNFTVNDEVDYQGVDDYPLTKWLYKNLKKLSEEEAFFCSAHIRDSKGDWRQSVFSRFLVEDGKLLCSEKFLVWKKEELPGILQKRRRSMGLKDNEVELSWPEIRSYIAQLKEIGFQEGMFILKEMTLYILPIKREVIESKTLKEWEDAWKGNLNYGTGDWSRRIVVTPKLIKKMKENPSRIRWDKIGTKYPRYPEF